MDKEQVLAMKAGRKLNEVVAEVVMGFKRDNDNFWQDANGRYVDPPKGFSLFGMLSPYSTDITYAWPIAVKMCLAVIPLWFGSGYCACCKASYVSHLKATKDLSTDSNIVICKEAPEAICKAALITKLEEGR